MGFGWSGEAGTWPSKRRKMCATSRSVASDGSPSTYSVLEASRGSCADM